MMDLPSFFWGVISTVILYFLINRIFSGRWL